MIVFVDTSALVAMIRREPDALALVTRLEQFETRITSGLAVWETVRAVARGATNGIKAASAETDRLQAVLDIRLVTIGADETTEAIAAHARYGKGTGHPARLNIGDCFAYDCARTHGARLLYKGDDFVHTDLA